MTNPTPDGGDVNLAKTTISRNDDLPDRLLDAFEQSADGTWRFTGTDNELSAIRMAMSSYEKNQASIGEDKSYYDARLSLQFIERAEA